MPPKAPVVESSSSGSSGASKTSFPIVKLQLYETQSWFYLVGRDITKKRWRVLKVDRSERSELNIVEDPVTYTKQECVRSLQRVAEGNKSTGGLNFVTKAYGIVGFIKFLEPSYMIIITRRRRVGMICGHSVYAIDESQMLTVSHPSVQTEVANSKSELRYKKLVSNFDLAKDFYFSYTYPLMHILQKNFTEDAEGIVYDNMFVWNAFLTAGIRKRLGNTSWTVPLVHGYFEQAKLSMYGRIFSLILISRRSRHFAGTRYLKRGLNDKGKVANDVETEQMIIDESYGSRAAQMSSSVQNRGSIPLFWSQEASRLSPKPDIVIQRYDPVYQATKLHFEDLAKRYGNPIIILNLIKKVEKRPREMMLRREFATAVGYLNHILPPESRLKFIHWDFHRFAKSKSANVLAILGAVASEALDHTGFYYSGRLHNVKTPAAATGRLLQSGVLRTNCIDCLDRTNVAQFAFGLAALARQLHALGLIDDPRVDPDSSMAVVLMDMYQNMGDALALQYGGSAAHNTVFPERQGKWKATTQSQELFKSIKRYYSNTYTDGEKQDAMNLFLGNFHPQEGRPALWELESDYYLHLGNDDEPCCDNTSKPKLQLLGICYDDPYDKLTSFDKLIPVTWGWLKAVKTETDTDLKIPGTAPDAAEVQLKSPNWLFGERKVVQEAPPAPTPEGKQNDLSKVVLDAEWVTSLGIISEDGTCDSGGFTSDVFDSEKWYGSDIFFGMVDDSPANQHYAKLCEVESMDPFDRSAEEADIWCEDTTGESEDVELEMKRALQERDEIGSELGCCLAVDGATRNANVLSKWIFS